MRGPNLPANFFKKNREHLLKKVGTDSLVIIRSAERMIRNADINHPFRQDSNFFYFTGIETPDCILLLIPENQGQPEEILFIKPIDPIVEKWEGRMLTKQRATEISGIKNVQFLDQFQATFFRAQHWRAFLYCEVNQVFPHQPLTAQHQFLDRLRQRLPGLTFKKLHELTTPLRNQKSPEEIDVLRGSIRIIDEALRDVMKRLKPGMMEYQVEAILTFHYLDKGCDRLGYEIIAAGGQNATVLHYVDNDHAILEGDLLLIDTGGEFGMYSGDITRTLPVNGIFSERQRHCYQAVLEVNKEFIERLKPGQTWKELYQTADEIMGETYFRYGLIDDPKDHFKISYHRIGHSLGLDIHDVSKMDLTLSAGSIITVEPGLYLPKEKIGIRIEDNILFTESGTENLSESIPKEISEIEELMK
ncbi:MAG: aminopeptidase P N-terminal domain-containing protein [Deltaproteobacteria bacterium]|nr:aminopeptidase P N-terminal domain-containing protein [Deltaproteobacteria bacterium]